MTGRSPGLWVIDIGRLPEPTWLSGISQILSIDSSGTARDLHPIPYSPPERHLSGIFN